MGSPNPPEVAGLAHERLGGLRKEWKSKYRWAVTELDIVACHRRVQGMRKCGNPFNSNHSAGLWNREVVGMSSGPAIVAMAEDEEVGEARGDGKANSRATQQIAHHEWMTKGRRVAEGIKGGADRRHRVAEQKPERRRRTAAHAISMRMVPSSLHLSPSIQNEAPCRPYMMHHGGHRLGICLGFPCQ